VSRESATERSRPQGAGIRMNFGRLQIATLWRVSKDGVERCAAVLDGTNGARLVILEPDRIVQWETFRAMRHLRQRAVEIRRTLRGDGWR
jgi:hypothetical protein